MNNVLLDGMDELSWLFQKKMVPYWLFGDFALSLHAVAWTGEHTRVDIAFQNDEEFEKAVRVVTEAGFVETGHEEWKGKKHEGNSYVSFFNAPDGAHYALAYIKNDVDLDYLNAPEIRAFGSTLRVFSEKDLKKIDPIV